MGRGFTMAEILTVVAVMAILMSIAAVGIQKMDRGQATTSALAVSQAIFAEARSVAMGRGTRARVYIHGKLDDGDAEDQQRYLRYMIVGVLEEGSDDEFEVVSRGTYLPNGVYFDVDMSEEASASVADLGTFGKDQIDLPGKGTNLRECYYYEFNGEGICVDGVKTNADPGAAFVVVGGVRARNAEKPKPIGNNRAGFVIWRNGQTAIYRNPDQIGR
jgi:prepilin-type N-terminal cleavage/methylation domain-containing protein